MINGERGANVTDNLYHELPTKLPDELTQVLIEQDNVRIERIVSTGHASPAGSWYDQTQHEWVIVLKGEAKLLIEGYPMPLRLKPGNFVNIPAGRKHRVEWTTSDEPTVWLAVFY